MITTIAVAAVALVDEAPSHRRVRVVQDLKTTIHEYSFVQHRLRKESEKAREIEIERKCVSETEREGGDKERAHQTCNTNTQHNNILLKCDASRVCASSLSPGTSSAACNRAASPVMGRSATELYGGVF